MRQYKFTAVIWKEDIGYVPKCSELGVVNAGDTLGKALENLKDIPLFRKCKRSGDVRQH